MLNKFSDWPSPKITNYLLWIGFIIYISLFPLTIYFINISGYAISDMLMGRLSFSGDVLKDHYKTIDIDAYRIGQILDFGILLGYGMALFSLSLIIARRYDAFSNWRKSGYVVSVICVFSACCDALENTFVLLTLTDSTGFPEIWAVLNSFFVLLTFTMLLCIGWIFSAAINLTIKKSQKRNKLKQN
ncbi:MAG: hypothetical protein ACFFAO_17640 [Candidatus Hermodarchaeota archaeon]